jgi:hypothetical protein
LIKAIANCLIATNEIEVLLRGLERPREPENGANAAETNEFQFVEIDRESFRFRPDPLFDGHGEVVAVGGFHATLGASNETLLLFGKFDLHNVFRPRVEAFCSIVSPEASLKNS